MTVDPRQLKAASVTDLVHRYGDTETMLYAQSIGLGQNPLDRRELSFVYEGGAPLRTIPTMATVLVPDLISPDLGWDHAQVLHVEQRLEMYRPLPPEAKLLINKRVVDVFDLGGKRGALILFEAEGRLAADHSALFTVGSTVIARGDGGFGGTPGRPPQPHRAPRRDPDLACEIATRRNQPLLFRLNGDRNPLHADPGAATLAGFDVPILHGLCTFGIACHAVLKTICDYDETLIRGFDARFSAPVTPGDRIRTDMWQDGNIVSFRCVSASTGAVLVKNGKCTLAA